MVVVKPNDKKAPDPTAKSPLPELGFDPLGIKERQEEAQIAKNKDLIRAKYYQLKDLLGDYATIKNVLIERSAVLKKYMELSDDDVNPLIASQVSSILIAPIKKDASLFFKITLIIFWFISFIAPIILLFSLDFKWYFDKL